MKTFKQFQEKLSDKEYKEVGALLNRDTLLRGNLIKNPTQRQKFATMSGRETFRRLKRNEDGKLRIDRGTEEKIKVNKHTVSKNFPELSKKPVEKYKKYYRLPEGVGALAVGGSKLIPALMTGIGAAGTIMQARKKRKIGNMEKRLYDRQKTNTDQRDDLIKSKPGEVEKQNKLIDRYSKRHKTPKQKNDTQKFLKDLARGEIIQDEFSAPTNNVGGGQIAGTVEAGDDPPVKKGRKKKKYIYGGRGSRKMWMNNK